MIKRSLRLLAALVSVLLVACLLVACTPDQPEGGEENVPTHTDLASTVSLDMSSSTRKQEVTVKTFVDGDTTHFHVPESVIPGGVLKARYLAVNTPESTGKIEEWGKAASNFTKEKLQSAASILVESDDDRWNVDSTGGRYLVWVWYKPAGQSEYRNLNIELLQNGLAIASNSANNRYGSTCMAAINQAKAKKLHVYSGQKDPAFPYGEAAELTLKELRLNVKEYEGSKVAFEGVVTKNNSNTVYVEDYDAETDMYYGMTVYYGYALGGSGLQILSVGNRVRIVGTVQYYETGDSYQISGLEHSPMRPTDPNNIQKLSEGHTPAWRLTSADTFKHARHEITMDDQLAAFDYAELALYTSVEMQGLTVKSVYTTQNEESSSDGAMTLTCEVDGIEITLRTIVLHNQDGSLVTADAFEGAVIDVKGLVDRFDGEYQIKVFSINDITFR